MPTYRIRGAMAAILPSSMLAAPAPAAPKRAATAPMAEPTPIRVVVVTAFEIGKDPGDMPGEPQAWADEIPGTLPVPRIANEIARHWDRYGATVPSGAMAH